jgi:tRNA(Ile)-lysidine synthase
MKKMLVAVSGGVDSVVLLDFLAEKLTREHGAEFMRANLVVAHFEHGIRGAESLADLEFVKGLAEKYGVKLVFEYGDLGEKASEEVARKARYDFLRRVAEAENAVIFTAHHKNDLAETFALNLARGGGWRAVACLDSPDIERPFLPVSKQEILVMAKQRGLKWREDSTNLDEKFARNKIRQNLHFSEQNLERIYQIWRQQVELKRQIEAATAEILPQISQNGQFQRQFFQAVPDEVGFEIVREILRLQSGEIPLSRQVWDFLHKIRTFRPHTTTQIPGGKEVKFWKEFFEF